MRQRDGRSGRRGPRPSTRRIRWNRPPPSWWWATATLASAAVRRAPAAVRLPRAHPPSLRATGAPGGRRRGGRHQFRWRGGAHAEVRPKGRQLHRGAEGGERRRRSSSPQSLLASHREWRSGGPRCSSGWTAASCTAGSASVASRASCSTSRIRATSSRTSSEPRGLFATPRGGQAPQFWPRSRALVRGFFQSAARLLAEGGEVHLTLKLRFPYTSWDTEGSAKQAGLRIVRTLDFAAAAFPGQGGGRVRRCGRPGLLYPRQVRPSHHSERRYGGGSDGEGQSERAGRPAPTPQTDQPQPHCKTLCFVIDPDGATEAPVLKGWGITAPAAAAGVAPSQGITFMSMIPPAPASSAAAAEPTGKKRKGGGATE